VGLIDRLLMRRTPQAGDALYRDVVARAREPHWYEQGEVADTIDGRFDMIAALLAIVMLRLERDDGPATRAGEVAIAEAFVDDMDPQLRQLGMGDLVVGKHVGKMMGMLGGRLGAYREALATGTLDAALIRNLYRDQAPSPAALAHVRGGVEAFHARLAATAVDQLLEGKLP
jgi:cytochrome b pre-mRNA-processing protein 3